MLNQINRSKIAGIILKAVALVKLKLQKLQAPPPAPTQKYGQVPLPLPKLGNTTKLIVMFLVASITTALMLPRVIGGIKVSTARPAITMKLPNHRTVNRIFWLLVSAAAIAAITEKDWRK